MDCLFIQIANHVICVWSEAPRVIRDKSLSPFDWLIRRPVAPHMSSEELITGAVNTQECWQLCEPSVLVTLPAPGSFLFRVARWPTDFTFNDVITGYIYIIFKVFQAKDLPEPAVLFSLSQLYTSVISKPSPPVKGTNLHANHLCSSLCTPLNSLYIESVSAPQTYCLVSLSGFFGFLYRLFEQDGRCVCPYLRQPFIFKCF